MNLDLSGKRALVTGSTLGIGRATAEALLKEGVSVVINGRNANRVSRVADELSHLGEVQGITADMSTTEGTESLIAKIDGTVDILVNNVGRFEVKSFFEISDQDWSSMFELNVMNGIRLSRTLAKQMLEQDWGRIIFIGSDQSSKPNPEMAHYAMTKTAQVSIARCLAELTRGTNVTVNSVIPGSTRSEGAERFIADLAKEKGKTTDEIEREFFETVRPTCLIKRFATIEEVATFVTYLVSPLAAANNGAALRVDGGTIPTIL